MARDPGSWWPEETIHAGREHFDEQHTRRYDAKEDAHAPEEVALLRKLGILGAGSCVVDLGAGTGQFTLAAAAVCRRVVAVDVSPLMLERLAEKLDGAAARNVEVVHAGFLTYEHAGPPADLVYSRYALHHLPDFWKAIALSRLAGMLRRGGSAAPVGRRLQLRARRRRSTTSRRGSRRPWPPTWSAAGPAPSWPNTCATSTRPSRGCWSR